MAQTKYYDHVFTVHFSVVTPHSGEFTDPVPHRELLAGLARRLAIISLGDGSSDGELFGVACDTEDVGVEEYRRWALLGETHAT